MRGNLDSAIPSTARNLGGRGGVRVGEIHACTEVGMSGRLRGREHIDARWWLGRWKEIVGNGTCAVQSPGAAS